MDLFRFLTSIQVCFYYFCVSRRVLISTGNGLFSIDLSKTWNLLETTYQYSFTALNGSGPEPRHSTSGGALFRGLTNGDDLVLYGGAPLAAESDIFARPNLTSVADRTWAFNSSVRSWKSPREGTDEIEVSQHGTYVQLPDKELGLYLDVSGLSVINLSSSTVQHVTELPTNLPRIGVQLQYLQYVGPSGVIALIGGALVLESETAKAQVGELVRYYVCCTGANSVLI